MASKRELKRQVKYMIYDVIDECFYISDIRPEKEEQAEGIIQTTLDFHEDIVTKISQAKSKKEFRPIIAEIRAKEREFVDALNSLN